MDTSKVAVYSLPDLKNATDDALPNYLDSLNFEHSHFLTDVRLALGYLAVIIAAVTFYFDHRFGWEETKDRTLWAVIVYFLLNGALTSWVWFVEKGKIFTGTFNGTMLSIASHVTKHTPVYHLTVRYSNATETLPFDWQTLEISAPYVKWFTAGGHFMAKPFQQWIASEVPLIGKADAEKANKNAKTNRF